MRVPAGDAARGTSHAGRAGGLLSTALVLLALQPLVPEAKAQEQQDLPGAVMQRPGIPQATAREQQDQREVTRQPTDSRQIIQLDPEQVVRLAVAADVDRELARWEAYEHELAGSYQQDTAWSNPELRMQQLRLLDVGGEGGSGWPESPLGGTDIGLRWRPPPLLGRESLREQVRLERLAARQEARWRAQQIAAGTLELYLRVLAAEDLVELARQEQRRREQLLQSAAARLRSGGTTALERTTAELETLRARVALQEQEASLRLLRRELLHRVGLPPGAELQLDRRSWSDTCAPLTDGEPPDRSARRMTQRERADIEAARLRLRAAELKLVETKAEAYPGLRFVELEYELDSGKGPDTLLLGAGITLPLLERGEGARQVAAASRELQRAELAARQGAASRELDLAQQELQATRARLQLLRQAGPLLERALSLSRQSLQVSQSDVQSAMQVLERQVRMRQAEAEVLLACRLAELRLRLAGGELEAGLAPVRRGPTRETAR